MSALKKIKTETTDPILALTQSALAGVIDAKAIDPVALNVTGKTSFADYLIVASGTSDRHVSAIANRILESVRKDCNRRPIGIEGMSTGLWVLIDFGDIVCHVFQDELRGFYRIEDLWHDAARLDVSGKKTPAKKTAVKKPAAKKTEAKKAAAKKAAPKKPVKKAAAKKAPAKKKKK